MQSRTFLCSCRSLCPDFGSEIKNFKFPPKWHRESTKWCIHAHSGKPALTSMKPGLSHWQDTAQFALSRAGAPHHGVVGRLVRQVRPLLDTVVTPDFGKSNDRGFSICLPAPALLLGPALRFPLYTQRAEILFSSPFFSFKEQLLGQHGAVQYRVSFWPRLLMNKAIKLMAGTFPKSLRAVAGTSTLGTDTQSIFQNIKKKNPFKIPLPRCLRSP